MKSVFFVAQTATITDDTVTKRVSLGFAELD